MDIRRHNPMGYIGVGERLAGLRLGFSNFEKTAPTGRRVELPAGDRARVREQIQMLHTLCVELGLTVAAEVFKERIEDLPLTLREFEISLSAFRSELSKKSLLFVPTHRERYFQLALAEKVANAFPTVTTELSEASNAYALGLFTACVFHSMRAVEIGVRAMAVDLGCEFKHGIEFADMHPIIEGIEAKIGEMKKLQRGPSKDRDLQFYSEAASQFRYFKDAWRVRVAHARASYTEVQARQVLDHTEDFFVQLAERLHEPELGTETGAALVLAEQ